MCTLLCVCPPRVESLFSPVLSKFYNQIPLAFKVWFSKNSSSRFRTLWFGSLAWGSEPLLQWVDFCCINVLQFVSHPPSSYGISFYCDCAPPTISLWLLLCLWMLDIFFGEFQCLPVNDCSWFFIMGSILCIAECWAASLVSTHFMPVATPHPSQLWQTKYPHSLKF